MANKEIYKIKIIKCVNTRWWYADLIGEEYYVTISRNLFGEESFIPIGFKNGRYIRFNEAEILEKVTKVVLPLY
jgi:hypothetical protein